MCLQAIQDLFNEIPPADLGGILDDTMHEYSQLALMHPDECSPQEVAKKLYYLRLTKLAFNQLSKTTQNG